MEPNQIFNQNQFPSQNAIPLQQELPPASQLTPRAEPPVQQQEIIKEQAPVQAPSVDVEEVAVPQNQNFAVPDLVAGQPLYSYILYAVALVLLVFFWKRLLEWLKRSKRPELPAEDDGTLCPTCGGKGTITKKRTITAPCKHCKQTGIDICHHCGGTGRNGLGYGVPLEDIENYPKCDYCGGKGFPKLVLRCCMCKGARKETYEESYEVTCPDYKGSGRKK